MLEGEELEAEERVREPGDVAGREEAVGHHPVDGDHPPPGVGGHPEGPGGQIGARQPLGVADGPEGDHGHIRLELGAVGERGGPQRTGRVALQGLHGALRAEVHPRLTLEAPGDLRPERPQRSGQGAGTPVHHRHLEAAGTADRGHFGAGEAGADHEDPFGSGPQTGGQGHGVGCGAHPGHPVEAGLVPVRPGLVADPGRDEEAVVGNLGAVVEGHVLVRPVQRDGAAAEKPLGVPEIREPCQRRVRCGAIGVEGVEQDLLREGRAVVGRLLLVADEGEAATEARVAYRLPRLAARSAKRRRPRRAQEGPRSPLSAGGVRSSSIARTGQARAAFQIRSSSSSGASGRRGALRHRR